MSNEDLKELAKKVFHDPALEKAMEIALLENPRCNTCRKTLHVIGCAVKSLSGKQYIEVACHCGQPGHWERDFKISFEEAGRPRGY